MKYQVLSARGALLTSLKDRCHTQTTLEKMSGDARRRKRRPDQKKSGSPTRGLAAEVICSAAISAQAVKIPDSLQPLCFQI
jgi:hypothetical protein